MSTTSNSCYCRRLASCLLLLLLLVLVEDATYTDAAPSITRNELTVLPRSLAELVDSHAFERIWRKAATDQIVERFGGRGAALPTRNMVGDTMGSEDFHQKVCKGSGQGMSSMGGMMSGQSAPVSYMGTFIGSEKFQNGSCDMMSQGMTQFGTGMNGAFRSTAAAAAAEATSDSDVQDPVLAIDEFFRSQYYEDARKQMRDMFSDVRFY